MAVMAREDWTDARIDDFKETVNQRFDQVDKRFDQVDKRFDQVDKRFEQVDKRFDRVEADIGELRADMKQGFESMHRTMVIGFVTLFASIAASLIGALALG
jgi:septal ring factor EnvC (AmiA/AmiB activator)